MRSLDNAGREPPCFRPTIEFVWLDLRTGFSDHGNGRLSRALITVQNGWAGQPHKGPALGNPDLSRVTMGISLHRHFRQNRARPLLHFTHEWQGAS